MGNYNTCGGVSGDLDHWQLMDTNKVYHPKFCLHLNLDHQSTLQSTQTEFFIVKSWQNGIV